MAKLLTVNEVAERLRVGRRRVLYLIASGRLKAEKMGLNYMVKEKDIDAVVYRPVGRPRKDKKR